jgi:LysR family transcriptional regulator, regulator of abg operon
MRHAHLRDLLAVADTGSVRAAARRLQITQGAVSKNLLALEREFGVPLLVRSTRGVELSDFGRVVVRRARLADAELRKARDEIAVMTGGHHRQVSIGLSSAAEALLMPPAIRFFRQLYPDTLVSISGGAAPTLVTQLREGRLDFAVTPATATDSGPDIRAERLFSVDFVAVVRAGHPCAHATELAELAHCEWVHGARPGEMEPLVAMAFRKARLPSPRFAVRRDSLSTLLYLLLGSDYVALATEPTVEPLCASGLLTKVPLRSRPGVSMQAMLTPASRPLTPPAEALANELARLARALGKRRPAPQASARRR